MALEFSLMRNNGCALLVAGRADGATGQFLQLSDIQVPATLVVSAGGHPKHAIACRSCCPSHDAHNLEQIAAARRKLSQQNVPLSRHEGPFDR
jgi:hypothetical protein